jgi:dihydroxy-acid dehydratase
MVEAETPEVDLYGIRRPSPGSKDAVLNKYSQKVTQGEGQGAAQAMLLAAGLTLQDLDKAQVGISSVWWEGNPCNMHLLDFGKLVKQSCQAAGLIGLQFNTVGISDGIAMGTQGMRFSLPSREIISDSIEAVTVGQGYDANVSVSGFLIAVQDHRR